MADVASAFRSWSVTAASNSPNTNTVVGAGLAPNLQQIQATVRQYLASIGTSVVCSATTDLSTVDGYVIPLSGNSTVTSFGTEAAGICYRLQFSGTPLLKGSTAIQTPTATSGDMSINAGDIVGVISQGSGNWKVSSWMTPNPRFNTLNASVITGSVRVTTPLITGGSSDLAIQGSGSGTFAINAAGNLFPGTDNGQQIGTTTNRLNYLYAGAEIFLGSASVVSGIGIAFPATQSASTDVNTLDDYEEGTWTPSVGGNATYTTQTGKYTKIGRMVFIDCRLVINVIGTGSTTIISGLPFTVSSAATATLLNVEVAGNSATSIVSATAAALDGTTTAAISSRTAAATADAANAIFQNGTIVHIAGCYTV